MFAYSFIRRYDSLMADTKENSRFRRRNLFTTCVAFVCVYTSFNAVNNLQSSFNMEKDVGLYSLGLISVASVVACFCLTVPIIYIGGYKWAIVSGQIGVLVYIVANMYPKSSLLYPSQYLLSFDNRIFFLFFRNGSGNHLWYSSC